MSLFRDGRPVLAVLYFPRLDEMFAATEGGGAFLDGVPCGSRTSSPSTGR